MSKRRGALSDPILRVPQVPSEPHHLVFVGGVHRSGALELANLMCYNPQVSGFRRGEGQHLQHVYPPCEAHGGPGRFALDPEARLTEASPLVSDATRDSLMAAWVPHWDPHRRVWMDMSVPNLIRMRFLQALFPNAWFIVVMRHPIPVSLATRVADGASMGNRLEHWFKAHDIMLTDRPYVQRLQLVRYETLVRDPQRCLDTLCDWLDIGRHPCPRPVPNKNERHFKAYDGFVGQRARVALARRYELQALRFGYSLIRPGAQDAPSKEMP